MVYDDDIGSEDVINVLSLHIPTLHDFLRKHVLSFISDRINVPVEFNQIEIVRVMSHNSSHPVSGIDLVNYFINGGDYGMVMPLKQDDKMRSNDRFETKIYLPKHAKVQQISNSFRSQSTKGIWSWFFGCTSCHQHKIKLKSLHDLQGKIGDAMIFPVKYLLEQRVLPHDVKRFQGHDRSSKPIASEPIHEVNHLRNVR